MADFASGRSDKQVLMGIAATLADCTQSPEHCAEIPVFLSHVLGLEAITLAVIRQSADDAEPYLVFSNSSGQFVSEEARPLLQRHLFVIFKQVAARPKPEAGIHGQAFTQQTEAEPYFEAPLRQFPVFPSALVFARHIDAAHRMLLVVHRRATDVPLSGTMIENLLMTAGELARQLYCLIAWKNSPKVLGKPFDRLTDQEWLVLWGLNSDNCEKQLASLLGLSRHTLHSHIKSIYRKFGVQGRLPLLRCLNSALHQKRMEILNC